MAPDTVFPAPDMVFVTQTALVAPLNMNVSVFNQVSPCVSVSSLVASPEAVWNNNSPPLLSTK